MAGVDPDVFRRKWAATPASATDFSCVAELGWVDGYTYAILAREWPTRSTSDETATPRRTITAPDPDK